MKIGIFVCLHSITPCDNFKLSPCKKYFEWTHLYFEPNMTCLISIYWHKIRKNYLPLFPVILLFTLVTAHLITLANWYKIDYKSPYFLGQTFTSIFFSPVHFCLFVQMAAQWPCHYRPETILEPPNSSFFLSLSFSFSFFFLVFLCSGISLLTLSQMIGLGMQKGLVLLARSLLNWTGISQAGKRPQGPIHFNET